MNLFTISLLCIVYRVGGTYRNSVKLNVLLIFVDDLRPLTEENINLPNIRKLAARSINFKNAFAQQALCAPSRNSMLTGRRPDALHLYDFYSYWRHAVGNFSTIPQFFKNNGYRTYSVGKVFHPGPSSNFNDDYPYSWTRRPYHPPSNIYKDAAVCKDEYSKRLHKNLICPVDVNKQPMKSLPDLQTLERAVDILENKRRKPFLLAVGFHKPHIPFKFPRKYLELFPIENVTLPKYPHIPEQLPLVAWQPWMDLRKRDDIKRLELPFVGIMPAQWTALIRQNYYAAAAYVDDSIGTLLNHVNRKNTIVVLTSDHGWSLGENGLWAKYSNFDVALKVPLIISTPRLPQRSIDTPVELLDLFPTLVDLAGLSHNITKCKFKDKSTLCFDGQSLVPMIKNSKRENDKSCAISQYPRPSVYPVINSDKPRLKNIKIMGYSIRTKRYRYTEWISFNNKLFTRNWNKVYGVELYDHILDPQESKNLHLNSKYKDIQKHLSSLLKSQVDPH